ncbi:hypothetical protein K493DRAFT_313890 [Basidiobolus meristosporus CBS 931.73]|uniref:RGS domain-containing protein n=1 Tax=Basidiobolus meristosporus CBS 931.73 TaxID=1314790 RepID=A0A1Y1YIP1_9FUNG|nr:hypothetical protein K493DRAFT_313890 [Basidiobolus meristosporus CBS 931.73]|eukprot:ORX97880.1 hypothetical protein K493DRAFT_313890 [Basidiobolus meristosporus CBS 931.73]
MSAGLILTCVLTPLWVLQSFGSSVVFWRHRDTDYIKYRSPKLSLLMELFVCIIGVLYMLRWSLTGSIPCFVIVWITEFGYPVIYLAIIARSVRLLFLYRLSEAKLASALTNNTATKHNLKSERTVNLKKRSSNDSGMEMRNLTYPSDSSIVNSNGTRPPTTALPLEQSWFHQHRYILSSNFLNTSIGTAMVFHIMILIVLQAFSENIAIIPKVITSNCFNGWEWIPHQIFVVLYNVILFIFVIMLRNVSDAYGIRGELLYMSLVNMFFDVFFIIYFHISTLRTFDPNDYAVNLAFIPLLTFQYHMIVRPVLITRGYPSITSLFSRRTGNDLSSNINAYPLTATKVSFEQVMDNYTLWEQFKLFAVQDFSVENVLFFERCRRLKDSWTCDETGELKVEVIETEVRDVYDTFITPNARLMVNLNGKTRRQIQEALNQKNISVDIFDRAVEEVSELMFRNTYPRFIQSRRSSYLKWEDVGNV